MTPRDTPMTDGVVCQRLGPAGKTSCEHRLLLPSESAGGHTRLTWRAVRDNEANMEGRT